MTRSFQTHQGCETLGKVTDEKTLGRKDIPVLPRAGESWERSGNRKVREIPIRPVVWVIVLY